jgi:capsular exopolysaccharide synthesis family protein
MLNSGLSSPQEVEAVLGRPVLSSVSLLSDSERKVDGRVENPINFLLKKPLSRYAEQVRTARVGIQMSDVDNPPKVVLLTSSVPKEGKSTLSICLAFSAAKSGQRVLLIDGDLRHSTTTKHFGLAGRPGLVDFLTGTTPLDQALVTSGSIVVMPAGSSTQNSADLLGSSRMRQMTTDLSAVFDYILIDSPPVGPVIDAKILTQLADKILYVVRWQSTPREIIAHCLDQLAADRKIAGIAFNLVNEKKTPRYGRYWVYSRKHYSEYYQQ